MNKNRKIKDIPPKYSNDEKEQEKWWDTPEGIDEFEKYINSKKNCDVDSRTLIPIKVLERFLEEGQEDFKKDLKKNKRTIKTVKDLKRYLEDIPDDAELMFYFDNGNFYTEDCYSHVRFSITNYQQLLVISLNGQDCKTLRIKCDK